MKIGPREQLILVVVGLIVALAAVAALLVWPQYQKQRSLDAQLTAAEQELSVSRSLLAQRQEIKNRAAMTDAKWLRLASLVPENPDLPSLIIELQDAAFASGVQIVALNPSDPILSVDKTHVVIELSVNIHGTWADTVDFLKRINNLERGLREVGFTAGVMTQPSTGPLFPAYSEATTVRLEAYTIPPSASASSTAAPAPAAP